MHENSLEAYEEEKPHFAKRHQLILDWFRATGSATPRECCEGLGFTDMNAVRPRIHELIKKFRVLEECGEKTDHETGRTTMVVRLKRPAAVQANLF